MFKLTISLDISSATSSRELADGLMLLDWLDGQTIDRSGPALAPASPSPSPEKARAKRTNATSGRHGLNSSAPEPPPVVMGEQVAAAVGKGWLDGVCADMEGIDYSIGAAVVPACAVDAPHRRDRLWFVADASRELSHRSGGARDRSAEYSDGRGSDVADATDGGRGEERPHAGGIDARDRAQGIAAGFGAGNGHIDADHSQRPRLEGLAWNGKNRSRWALAAGPASEASGSVFVIGADGKARRVEPSIRLLAHGVSARVGKLRAYGNAIVPQVAAEIIGAYLDSVDPRRDAVVSVPVYEPN